MPSSKTRVNRLPKSSATKTTKKSTATKSVRAKAPWAAFGPGGTMTKYLVPAGALLGSGVLVAAGILMKAQIGGLLHAAVKSAAAGGVMARNAATEQLDLQRLLAHVGLQRKRHAAMGATLGVFAGLIAGSALATWVAPILKEKLAQTHAPNNVGKEPATNSSTYRAPAAA